MPRTSPHLTGLIVLSPAEGPSRAPGAVALTGVEVDARVEGPTTRVSVKQRYENRESVPIEATYVFPLPEGAAVCDFNVTLDGHRLEGVVKERDEAFDQYDDAMAEGRGAFLLDQERPNIFTASVGNLLPGQSAEIELQWVSELEREGDGFRLAIPSTVSPRYVPDTRRDAEGMDDAERIHPPVTTEPLPYGLKLVVDVDLLAPLRSVESPSHKIRVDLDGPRARVQLAGDEGRLDRDVVIQLVPAEATRPLAGLVADERGDRFAVATLTPHFAVERPPLDVTFLLDCSGSMSGSSIAEARETLRVCLRSLHPGDRFDIVRFGSDFERLFGQPRDYDDDSLEKADKWLQSVAANLGGTEILAPLKAVLSESPEQGRARRLVLLTDGQVSNEDEVLHLVSQHRHATKVFTFGIGHGASEYLVRGAARASGGASEMVAPGEKIEDKVMRQFKRLAQPTLDGLRLEWEGLEVVDVIPRELDAVFTGEPITAWARVLGGDRGTVRLLGRCGDAPWQAEIDVAPIETTAPVVPTLWARKRIRELEEGDVWTGLRGSQQRRRKKERSERDRDAVKAELVELGARYGLLSAATSYVVIDDRADAPRAEIPAQLRETPTALTHGWLGVASATMGSSGDDTVGCELFSPPSEAQIKRAWQRRKTMGSDATRSAHFSLRAKSDRGDAAPQDTAGDIDRRLLLRQRAEGSWNLDQLLADWAEIDLGVLRKLVAKLGKGPVAGRLVATMLVLRAFEARPDGVPDRWAGALDKAREWVAKTATDLPVPAGFANWTEWVARVH